MGWSPTDSTKIIHRNDDARAEEVMPHSIDDDTTRQRIVGRGDLGGESEPPASNRIRLLGSTESGQHFQVPARHGLTGLSKVASPKQRMIVAVAVGRVRDACRKPGFSTEVLRRAFAESDEIH